MNESMNERPYDKEEINICLECLHNSPHKKIHKNIKV